MRAKVTFTVLVAVVVALVGLAAVDTPQPAASSGRAFSAVGLHPDVVQALRAKGKSFTSPFPNSINRGRKFNPGGEVVGPLVTAGTQKVLVIFAQFTTPPPGSSMTRLNLATYFDAMLFGTVYNPPEYVAYPTAPTDRTLRNYYQAVSYGAVTVTTDDLPSVRGWAQVGKAYDYYCKADGLHDNGFGYYPQNAQGLVVDAVKAVDAVVDFSQYAVDGEVPNLFVVVAGTGAEWSGDPGIFWSHSWSIGTDAGTDLPGGYLTNDGVRINNYALMPEVGGDLTGFGGVVRGPYPPTVGVYAHEYGHVLGLPDQYDYGYESDGTGIYSLMAGGSWNTWPRYNMLSGNSPAFLDAWSRYRLGFVTPTEITSMEQVTLPPAETDPVVFKMVVPNSGGEEYFLLENRQLIGFDQGLNMYSDGLVHGLAIYHIDDVVLNRNYWRPNEAENWKKFRSEGWKAAWTGETHYGISIIQADDRWDLEHAYYGAFRSDLFPGSWSRTIFGNFTAPNSSSYYFWPGSEPRFGYSGVTVEDITETGTSISAKLSYSSYRK